MAEAEEAKASQLKISVNNWIPRFIPIVPHELGTVNLQTFDGMQVAGHAGFLTSADNQLYKPVSRRCARGRREHLFYQLVTYFKRGRPDNCPSLYFKDFHIFMPLDETCDCKMDPETLESINAFIAEFFHVKHFVHPGDDFHRNIIKQNDYTREYYNQHPICPCYNNDKRAKATCFLHCDSEDYMCITNLLAHCKDECVLDIKVGRITYDPMASPYKRNEQINKYPLVDQFGFRLLGKRTDVFRDKLWGRHLTTHEQVSKAIEGYFEPLHTAQNREAVICRMLDRLRAMLEWFETKNVNQFRFYSSSLLFVYDNAITSENIPQQLRDEKLKASCRVAIIDFAHVFHSHVPFPEITLSAETQALNKDSNFLYGLRRLVKYFVELHRKQRGIIRQEELAKPYDYKDHL